MASESWLVVSTTDATFGPFATAQEAQAFAARQPGYHAYPLARLQQSFDSCCRYGLSYDPSVSVPVAREP